MLNLVSIIQVILTLLFTAPSSTPALHNDALEIPAVLQCTGVYETKSADTCSCIDGYIRDYLTESCVKEAYITIEKPENGILINKIPDSFQVSGAISDNCDEVTVSYYNYNKLKDQHKLSKFYKGDTNFRYNISETLKNIANGENKYLVTATCEGKQIVTDSVKVQFSPAVTDYAIEQDLGFSDEDAYLVPVTDEILPIQPASISTYKNIDGITVQSPTYYSTVPSNASARCKDGTYSFSLNRRGTCSGHGGVAVWY